MTTPLEKNGTFDYLPRSQPGRLAAAWLGVEICGGLLVVAAYLRHSEPLESDRNLQILKALQHVRQKAA